MRFRTGLLLGAGAGYVLGTRAGRERYEQIVDQWNKLTGSPQVQKATERTRQLADKATSAVKERTGQQDEMSPVMDDSVAVTVTETETYIPEEGPEVPPTVFPEGETAL